MPRNVEEEATDVEDTNPISLEDHCNETENDNERSSVEDVDEDKSSDPDSQLVPSHSESEPESTSKRILQSFSRDWLLSEVHHRVSKEASNSFFELGKKWIPLLADAKKKEKSETKTPQFVHLRRQLYDKNIPPIHIEVSYKNKETGEITLLKDLQSVPSSAFPRNIFQKMYEIAYMKVITIP